MTAQVVNNLTAMFKPTRKLKAFIVGFVEIGSVLCVNMLPQGNTIDKTIHAYNSSRFISNCTFQVTVENCNVK